MSTVWERHAEILLTRALAPGHTTKVAKARMASYLESCFGATERALTESHKRELKWLSRTLDDAEAEVARAKHILARVTR